MRTTTTRLCTLAVFLALGHLQMATAATAEKPSQQDKMKACNATAKEKNLKGDERKAFMSDCLKAK